MSKVKKITTARQRGWGKVMFSQVFVFPQSVSWLLIHCLALLAWALPILLECFLVSYLFICQLVSLSGGPHVTITHDTLDLTVQPPRDLAPWDMGPTHVWQAGDTHPTGMLSCFHCPYDNTSTQLTFCFCNRDYLLCLYNWDYFLIFSIDNQW